MIQNIDGVCDELEIAGCTDSTAFNYDSSATDDDGSCVAVVEGCMELDAYNCGILTLIHMMVHVVL